jgi:hypothetical protein
MGTVHGPDGIGSLGEFDSYAGHVEWYLGTTAANGGDQWRSVHVPEGRFGYADNRRRAVNGLRQMRSEARPATRRHPDIAVHHEELGKAWHEAENGKQTGKLSDVEVAGLIGFDVLHVGQKSALGSGVGP